MMNILTSRNIRINAKDGRVAFSKRLIDRKDLTAQKDGFITIDNALYAFAVRINRAIPIDVCKDESWLHIGQMDINALEKAYTDEVVEEDEDSSVKVQYIEITDHVEDNIVEEIEEAVEEIKEEVEESLENIETSNMVETASDATVFEPSNEIEEDSEDDENEVDDEGSVNEEAEEENSTNNIVNTPMNGNNIQVSFSGKKKKHRR